MLDGALAGHLGAGGVGMVTAEKEVEELRELTRRLLRVLDGPRDGVQRYSWRVAVEAHVAAIREKWDAAERKMGE